MHLSRSIAALLIVATATFTAAADPAEDDAIAKVRALGGTVMKISAKSEEKEVAFHLSGSELTDDGLAHVKDIQNVVWLRLRGTKITDAGLTHLAEMKSLRKIGLELTGIGDSGLAHLKGLENLEYLNLYGTKVTDAGLAHLDGLANLKKLYVWQSAVTPPGADKLKEKLASLTVIGGKEFEPPKPDPIPIEPIVKAGGNLDPPASEKEMGEFPVKGRFVRISLKGDERALALAEVEVYVGDKAIQADGKALASSQAYGGVAKRANDGNTDQNFKSNSVAHTETETDPWWMVDLRETKDISKIRVFNRLDCCGDRLADAIVEVISDDNKVVLARFIASKTENGSVHDFAKAEEAAAEEKSEEKQGEEKKAE